MSGRQEERQLQRRIVAWVRKTFDCRCVHVPNGGSRHVMEAIALKADGVTAGYPDLVIHAAPGRTCFLEVKTETGRVSDAQTYFIADLKAYGFDVAVVRDLEGAKAVCEAWKLPPLTKKARSIAELESGF
jgi:hypothetical protein